MKNPVKINRRKLNKWRTRINHIINRAQYRGFGWFVAEISIVDPLVKAAKSVGVDLIQKHELTAEETHALLKWVYGDMSPWEMPTRNNLEI